MYYDLWWDAGSAQTTWESFNSQLTEGSDGETVIKATINGLSSGIEYNFKYRTQNIHGWSLGFSPSVLVKTLTEPAQITGVKTEVVSNNVRISWLEPYSGGVGIDIQEYRIEVQKKDGFFVEDASCLGNDPTIIANQYCDILMSSLTEEPYNFILGDSIFA